MHLKSSDDVRDFGFGRIAREIDGDDIETQRLMQQTALLCILQTEAAHSLLLAEVDRLRGCAILVASFCSDFDNDKIRFIWYDGHQIQLPKPRAPIRIKNRPTFLS